MRKFAAMMMVLVSASGAQAARYDLWAGHDGITNVSAIITTSDTLNSVGGYDVIGIEGTTTWGAITALITNPSQPGTAFYWPDGHVTADYQPGAEWPFDNVLFDNGGAWFSENGVLFQTDSAVWNVAQYQGQDYLGISQLGTFSATEWNIPIQVTRIADGGVPEPASWVLMIAGFGLVGAALPRRRRVAVDFG